MKSKAQSKEARIRKKMLQKDNPIVAKLPIIAISNDHMKLHTNVTVLNLSRT
jgi:hypothetical protein